MDKELRWPKGIRPHGKGIQIRVQRRGKPEYSETVQGDPHNKADLASAVKRREQLIARIKLGLPLNQDDDSQKESFEFSAQEYLNLLEAKRNTSITYENILNRYWMPHFNGWPVDEIKQIHIKKCLSSLDVSQKTKRNILIPLIGLFDLAEVQPNPARGIKLKKHQKPKIERYTPNERSALLDTLEGQSRVYFALLFGCGLRPCGEPLALEWPDYDGEELDIHKQITRRRLEPTTKTYITRKVYVPQWVRKILNAHPTRFSKGRIFVNSQGNYFRDTDIFNADWKAAHKRLGFRYRVPYVCRHTRASELLSTGVDPGDAAKQMGHSLEMFLRIYAEWIDEFSKNRDKSRFEGLEVGQTQDRN